MPIPHRAIVTVASVILIAVTAIAVLTSDASASSTNRSELTKYRVTLIDLTAGQPFSPPVIVTHRKSASLFDVGMQASDELAALAQNGDPQPLIAALAGRRSVTETVNVGHPLTPLGTTVGTFTSSASVEISARRSDRISLASMLICTNDGFVGLDSVRLPSTSDSYVLNAYDAGREENTQLSSDVPDPCSAVGPVPLAGDPNGNRNDEVASNPRQPIQPHSGIVDVPGADLTPGAHGWAEPVGVVVITRLSQ